MSERFIYTSISGWAWRFRRKAWLDFLRKWKENHDMPMPDLYAESLGNCHEISRWNENDLDRILEEATQ